MFQAGVLLGGDRGRCSMESVEPKRIYIACTVLYCTAYDNPLGWLTFTTKGYEKASLAYINWDPHIW